MCVVISLYRSIGLCFGCTLMRWLLSILTSLLLLGCTAEQGQVEQELADTQAKLAALPDLKINTLVPTMGYLSTRMETAEAGDEVSVRFNQPKPIDTVVLVPLSILNNQNEYEASGFPIRFKIEAQTADGQTITIADHTESDFPNPGIAPLVFTSADPRPAQSLSLTVTKLAQEATWRSKEYIFALNELLVFSGEENIALNAEVSAQNEYTIRLMFGTHCLVDGYSYFTPVVPPENNPNRQFYSFENEVRLFFDLGEQRSFDEIRLYPHDFSPQYSHVHSTGVGFPSFIEMQVSSIDSFENASSHQILREKVPTNVSTAPLCHKLKDPVSGRYVQLILRNGRPDPRRNSELIALSEIELLEHGKNLLHGIPVQMDEALERGHYRLSSTELTDGEAIGGKIIPQKEWFLQLAQRAELERTETDLLARKEALYNRQTKALRSVLIALPFLVLVFLLILLRYRYQNRKKIQAVRERIADDLHDEVGATLTGIANAADLLEEVHPASSPKEKELLAGISSNARRTAKETRSLIRFLEQKNNDSDLIEQFKITIEQMLTGISVQSDFQAQDAFNALPPIQKWDLLLFFKEALNNIVKHANAGSVEIRTYSENKKRILSIADDGKGLPNREKPEHLLKRASKLHAKLEIIRPETGGTTIRLVL